VQTLAACQLCKGHGQKLIVTTQLTHAVIALMALDALAKFVTREKIHQLSKHGAPSFKFHLSVETFTESMENRPISVEIEKWKNQI